MVLAPGDTLYHGQYRIQRLLGRGGFGFVYQATDTLIDEQVAIKELIPALVGDESMLKRFLTEAKMTLRLTHPRIVRTHNIFQENNHYYIVMEYMPGGSLEAMLAAHGSLTPTETVRIIAQVCEGLSYAHAQGVVHCDLKPANVLFAADGGAKVADFGIAHASEEMLTRTWQTPRGFTAGTLPYMSPEQTEGLRNDPRIDVYALGAMMYRMLTGRVYLDFDPRETPRAQADNVYRITHEQPAPPGTHDHRIPAWLDQVVLTALTKQPAGRYAGAAALRAALSVPAPKPTPTAALPPRAAPTPAVSRPSSARLPRWFWLLAGLAAVLLVAVVAGLAALLRNGNSGRQVVVVTSEPSPTPAPAPTAPPTNTALPEGPALLYQTDFATASDEWVESSDGHIGRFYEDGQYHLTIAKDNWIAWQQPNLYLSDFYLSVEATQQGGPDDNEYGVLLRLVDSANFYSFQISGDGYYRFRKSLADEWVDLIAWTTAEAIHQGNATNLIEVMCRGDTFAFYVNDVALGTYSDDSFAAGDIALFVGRFETGDAVHVSFDNLSVWAVD